MATSLVDYLKWVKPRVGSRDGSNVTARDKLSPKAKERPTFKL